jgi:hypothetical protein
MTRTDARQNGGGNRLYFGDTAVAFIIVTLALVLAALTM